MERILLTQLLLVGCGGFIGSSLRFVVQTWVHRSVVSSQFPWGTLAVNVIGCLLIGFLGGLAEHRQAFDANLRLFILVGVLGGFTTFSTFAYDSLVLAQSSQYAGLLLNVVLQIVIGFGAALLGLMLARTF
jgi:CrcB protein